MSLVETEWLNKNIDAVKIIDSSWHMPQTKRNGLDEYKNHHIQNVLYRVNFIENIGKDNYKNSKKSVLQSVLKYFNL